MRMLHTSDLHLGKQLHETSLIEDQRYILEQIVGIAKDEKVEAVLIAGDVYDRSVGSEEAIRLYSDFLKELHGNGCKVFIIPGNHDSSERVGCLNTILSEEGIHISGRFDGKMERVQIKDEFGPVNIWLLPFFRMEAFRFPEGTEKSFDNAFKCILDNSGIDFSGRNVLLSHQFFSSGDELDVGGSEKEKPSMGGEDCISADLLKDFDYVALGHIHKAQTVGREEVRYSGSPLKYSEKEHHNDKSVVILDVKEKGNVDIKTVKLRPMRDVRIIEGTVDMLIEAAESAGNTKDYVYVKLTEPALDAKQRLSQVFPNILSIVMSSYDPEDDLETKSIEEIRSMEPIDLFKELFLKVKGKEMSEKQIAVFQKAYAEVRRKEVEE